MKSSYLRIIENNEIKDNMPKYWEYINEEYERLLIRYEIISLNGLNIDNYINTRGKALSLVSALGKSISFLNGDKGISYSNNGLIIATRNDILKIEYNKEVVLSEIIYVPGEWEQVIEDLYNNIKSLLLEKNRKNKTMDNLAFLSKRINGENGSLTINDSISVQIFNRSNRSDNYINYGVEVVSDERKVYSYSKSGYDYVGLRLETKMKYKPGKWEEIIDNYIEQEFENDYVEMPKRTR